MLNLTRHKNHQQALIHKFIEHFYPIVTLQHHYEIYPC